MLRRLRGLLGAKGGTSAQEESTVNKQWEHLAPVSPPAPVFPDKGMLFTISPFAKRLMQENCSSCLIAVFTVVRTLPTILSLATRARCSHYCPNPTEYGYIRDFKGFAPPASPAPPAHLHRNLKNIHLKAPISPPVPFHRNRKNLDLKDLTQLPVTEKNTLK